MGKQALDRKLEALAALRADPGSQTTLAALRKALRDRNNFFVSKAAALVAEMQHVVLESDLLTAFDRYFIDAAKTDPQCWAKSAIAKALRDLGHRDAAVFVRGLRHFQPEPVWGGQEDTAPTLRSTCALALPACTWNDIDTLACLLEGLADPARSVRIDATRAIAQLPRPESALLLRLKVLTGDREPEVIGYCFLALLSIDVRESMGFVERFLTSDDDDLRAEAAAALAQSHEPAAVEALRRCWERERDPVAQRTFLTLLGSSPVVDAAEFLLSVAVDYPPEAAADALAALSTSRYAPQYRERAAAAVEARRDPRIERAFAEHFPEAAARTTAPAS